MEYYNQTGHKSILYPQMDSDVEFMLDDVNKIEFDTIASYALPTNSERDREDCSLVTGTHNESIGDQFSETYPNPATSGETIHVDVNPMILQQLSSVMLHDINGRKMLDIPVDTTGIEFPTVNMVPGMYILHAMTKAGKMHSAKIIIQ